MGSNDSAKWNLLHMAFAALTGFGLSTFSVDPYFMYSRGGCGPYLLIYYVTLFLTLPPIVFVHMKLGGVTESGLVGMLAKHVPILTGAGFAQMIYCFLYLIYVPVLGARVFYYMVASIVPGAWDTPADLKYPWDYCGYPFNTPSCLTSKDLANNTYWTPAESEFYRFHVVQTNKVVEGLGGMDYPLPVCLFVLWVITALMTAFSIRIYGWLLSIMGTLFLTSILAVIIYGYTNVTRSAIDDVYPFFYFSDMSPRRVLDSKVWADVAMRHTFVVNLLLGFLPAMGKFVGKGTVKTNMKVCLKRFCESSWLFIIFAMIIKPHIGVNFLLPYYGLLTRSLGVSFNNVMAAGLPQVAFYVLPRTFARSELAPGILFLMYLSMYLSILYFSTMGIAVMSDAIKETFPQLKGKKLVAMIIKSSLCAVCFLLGLTMVTRGGDVLFTTLDFFLHFFGVITMFFTLVGLAVIFVKQTQLHIVQRILVVVWFGVSSLILTGFVIGSMASTGMPDKDLELVIGQNYDWSFAHPYLRSVYKPIGILVACSPFVLGLPLGIVYAILSSKGTMAQRIRYVLCGEQLSPTGRQTNEPLPMDAYPRQPLFQENEKTQM